MSSVEKDRKINNPGGGGDDYSGLESMSFISFTMVTFKNIEVDIVEKQNDNEDI